VPIPTTQSNYQTTRWTNYQIVTLEGDLPAELEEPRIQNLLGLCQFARTTLRAACYADASSYDIEVGGLVAGST
jgi:hypothetical protein